MYSPRRAILRRKLCPISRKAILPALLVAGVIQVFGAARAGADTPFTATYNLTDTLTVIGSGASGGQLTYGVSGPVVDHQFDGKTILINSITITANGNATGTRVNFDWNVWFNNSPLGLTPGGAQTAPNFGVAASNTTPGSYSTGWHFVVGNSVLATVGAFPLSASHNFQTGASAASPHRGPTTVATSIPADVSNGLNLQVAAWSGDNDATTVVNFTMSNIQLVVTGVIEEAGSLRITEFPTPAPNSFPEDFVTGPDGNIWLAEGIGKIAKITTAGAFTEYPVPVQPTNQVSNPFGMTAGPDGALWFTDIGGTTDPLTGDITYDVGRITTSGVISAFALPRVNVAPLDIVSGSDGNLWVSELDLSGPTPNDAIARITPAGVITEFPTPAGVRPNQMIAGPDGNIWFTLRAGPGDTTGIGRITTSGTYTIFPIPTATAGNQMTIGPDGNMWFTEPSVSQIAKITPAGFVTEYPIPSGNEAHGITAGSDGNIWFAELFANKIGIMTVDGTVLEELPIGTIGSVPDSMNLGPDGNVWVVEFSASKMARVSVCPLADAPANLTIAPAGNGSGPATGTDYLDLAWQAATPISTEFGVPTAGSTPAGISSGPDDALWFTEFGTNKIGRITPTGAFTEFNVPTTGSQPVLIALGPDSALWFTEQAGNKIGQITTAGVFTEFNVPTADSAPTDITSGPDGALWFTEQNGNKIGRISTAGVITEFVVPTTGSGPAVITSGPDGALWFTETNSGKIGRISTAGVITEFNVPTPGINPRGITSGSDGALWFAESNLTVNKIGRITPAGAITEFNVPTALSGPNFITSGPDGALWFTEGVGKVGRITTAGAITEFDVPTRTSDPAGITLGPDGALWFTEINSGKIGRITVPGSPPTRYEYRINGGTYTSTTDTSGQAPPTGSNDPITLYVRAYACDPEIGPGPEGSRTVSPAPPQASFTVSPASPAVNQVATLTDTSSPQATSWLWIYDDGTPASELQAQTHTFTKTGNHQVWLLSTNGAGTSLIEKTVTVGASASTVESATLFSSPPFQSDGNGRQIAFAVTVDEPEKLFLHLGPSERADKTVYLRFLDVSGAVRAERRLSATTGEESVFDLGAYGLRGQYDLEIVSGTNVEAWVTASPKNSFVRDQKGDRHE